MFNRLSLKGRFLVAPVIGIVLTIILFAVDNVVIQSQSKVLRELNETNLSQISEISRFTVLLVSDHAEFSTLLHKAPTKLDEEQVYLQGRKILDSLHEHESILMHKITHADDTNASKRIRESLSKAFQEYKAYVISAIEHATVDTELAHSELAMANVKLEALNEILLGISEDNIQYLNQSANDVEQSLNTNHYFLALTFFLMLLMIFSAFYFSHHLSRSLKKIIDALVLLSKNKTNVYLEMPEDDYLKEMTRAVIEFKKALLHLEEQKFALDQHSIVAITDVQGNITYANDKFSQISGYTKEELMGKNHRILNSGQHDTKFWRDMYKVVANGEVWQNTVCNRSKQGELYWVDTTIVPFKGEDGKPFSYISIRTDVTAKRLAEIERLRAIQQAERANQAKSEFISSMSHELRTPLNSIIGFTQLMLLDEETPLTSAHQENAEYVLSSGNYLLELVNQILDLAKIEKGEDSFRIEEIDLDHVILEVVEVNTIAASKADITLEALSELPIRLHTDRTKVRQIVTNLIDNAIKYSEPGAKVTVDWSITDNQAVRVCVTDTGIGIPLEKQKDVFSAFNRLGKENSAILGTGIGLVITKKLVESLGGEIGFESAENQGSQFWFVLPIKTSSNDTM